MDESKQNRKTPLTTVSISQELASKLDELLKSKYPGMKRKEFLEAAVLYFERTGYDLSSDQMDFSSLERLTSRLEASAKIIDEENKGRAEFKQFLMEMKQHQLSLPSVTDITLAHEAKTKAETELSIIKQELEELKEEIADTSETLGKRTKQLLMAKNELKRLQKGFWNKPDENILKELGI